MPEIKVPNKEFKVSIGKELREDRIKVQSPSLFKEIPNNTEKVVKYGVSSNNKNM